MANACRIWRSFKKAYFMCPSAMHRGGAAVTVNRFNGWSYTNQYTLRVVAF